MILRIDINFNLKLNGKIRNCCALFRIEHCEDILHFIIIIS